MAQYEVFHQPPADYRRNRVLNITVKKEQSYRSVELFYRKIGDNSFSQVTMIEKTGVFSYRIPADYLTDAGLEYAILVTLEKNQQISFPAIEPLSQPHQLFPGIEPANQPLLLTPEVGETLAFESTELLIAISLFHLPNRLSNVDLYVNDVEMTDRATISDELITLKYQPDKKRTQRIELAYNDRNIRWQFFISQQKKRMNYFGSVNGNGYYEKINQMNQSGLDINGRMSANYGGQSIYSQLFLTSRESRYQQPLNRINLSYNNSILDIVVGDYFPTFTELSLYGKRVRGLSANLDWKWMQLETLWGFSKRAIKGDIMATLDSLTGSQYDRTGYEFEQRVLGIKSGFNIGNHAEMSLYFLKTKDDTGSVAKNIGQTPEGSTITMPVKPRESLNIGLNFNLNLDNNRLQWQNEIGMSQLNRNIYGGAFTLSELDTYFVNDSIYDDTASINDNMKIALDNFPIDPEKFQHIFTINQYMEPLLPIIPDSSGNIGISEFWNMPGLSVLSKLRLNYFNNFFILEYKKIGKAYNSLMNPYLQKDFQEIRLGDRIRLLDDKLISRVNFRYQIDNYSLEERYQYTRQEINLGLSYYGYGKFPDININTFFDLRQNKVNQVDTIYFSDRYQLTDNRIKTRANRVNFSLSQAFESFGRSQKIYLNATLYQNYDAIDDRPNIYTFQGFDNYIVRLFYQMALWKKSLFSVEVRKNISDYSDQQNDITGFGATIKYLEKRNVWHGSTNYYGSVSNGIYDYSRHRFSVSVGYNIFKQQELSAFAKISLYQPSAADNYTNYLFNLAWSYRF